MAGLTPSTSLLTTCGPYTLAKLDENAYSTGIRTPETFMRPYQPTNSNAEPIEFGLLQNLTGPKTTNDTNAYMNFSQLNDAGQRNVWLNNRYTTLVIAKIIPESPSLTNVNTDNNVRNNLNQAPHSSEPLAKYSTDLSKFITTVGKEYCYYQNNYMYALNNFLNTYSGSSTSATTTGDLNRYRDTAIQLNAKVNTLIAFINHLSNKRLTELSLLKSQLDQQNSKISGSTYDLNEQAKILSNNNNNNILYKQMVDYTAEKNRANQNLLAVYFTLNVVAIAGLFVIARVL
jgi:hypothetical protein